MMQKIYSNYFIISVIIFVFLIYGCSAHKVINPPKRIHLSKIQISESLPKELLAVTKYIKNVDPFEAFTSPPPEIRIIDFEIIDIGFDGTKEVVLLVNPRYQQSPTILFYQVQSDLTVSRVPEALAPGPLVPTSGEKTDSHILGIAVDFSLSALASAPTGNIPKDVRKNALMQAIKSNNSQVVMYNNFNHMDTGDSKGFQFVDMSHQKHFRNAKKCKGFEFAQVSDIVAGYISKKAVIAALVDQEIYLYKIISINKDSKLVKESKTLSIPPDFSSFKVLKNGILSYIDINNNTKALKLSW
ncbi:hypothetical protein QUF75_19945 [Desulfococcaceae bacterium HSG7]|nr:hypothetical protein [Desulfococcaceae bacterium HSG7]